jgi:hypothetical protein
VRRGFAAATGHALCHGQPTALARTRARNAQRAEIDVRQSGTDPGAVGVAVAARRRARSGDPAAARKWRSGAPTRGPPKNRDEALTSSITVLAAGIDSLYVSFKGETDAVWLDSIELLKVRAQETGQPQLVPSADGCKALVQPSGWGSYRYWLSACDLQCTGVIARRCNRVFRDVAWALTTRVPRQRSRRLCLGESLTSDGSRRRP